MSQPSPEILTRLDKEKNIWLATVRPDGRPHLVPVWFVWEEQTFFICIASSSVKYGNLLQNNAVSLSLEDGSSPLICEGSAEPAARPWPSKVITAFQGKYDWQIDTDEEYDALVRITPRKWLSW